MLITESWLNPSISNDAIHVDDYINFRCDRHPGPGGGVLIYAHKKLSVAEISIKLPPHIGEHAWVIINLSSICNLLVGCIYRPPGFDQFTDQALHYTFFKASEVNTTFKLISGDFNLPDVMWLPDTFPRKLNKTSGAYNLGNWIQHVTSPTRINNILDLVFTSGITMTKTYVSHNFASSDHKLVHGSINYLSNNRNNEARKATNPLLAPRNLNLINEFNINEYLSKLDWSFITEDNGIDIHLDMLYNHLQNCLDNIAPINNCYTKYCKPGFLTTSSRRKLRSLSKSFYNKNDLSAYTRIREIMENNELIRLNKMRTQELNAISSTDRSIKLTHLYRSRHNSSAHSIQLINHNNNEILTNDPTEICELFADYFSSCFNVETDTSSEMTIKNTPSQPCLSTITFNDHTIYKLIQSFKPSKSVCPDGLPPYFLKYCLPNLIPLINKIYTISLTSSTYPEAWKSTLIRPKHKSGTKTEVSNYRPINITPILSRIMERIVKSSMNSFLIDNGLLSPAQHGFMNKKSCSTSHVELFDHISTLQDTGHIISIVYFDFNKAFDTVPHKKLLYKLQLYGFRDPLYSWIQSFLKDRSQFITIEQQCSSRHTVPSGVIQGSVLGPLLFLLYINDITGCIKNGRPFLFADDLKIVYSTSRSSTIDTNILIQQDLNNIDLWCKTWTMKLNSKKCGIMPVSRHSSSPQLSLNDAPLTILNSIKDLGISYSKDLSLNEHITRTTSKAYQIIGFICKNFETPSAKIILFKTFARPLLEYCSFLFCNLNKYDITRIERVQRRLTKRILGYDCTSSYISRCENLGIKPLWFRRLKLNLIFFYKILHKNSSTLTNLNYATDLNYSLRNSTHRVVTHFSKNNSRFYFFLNMYSAIWNRLPELMRSCNSITKFKSLIDEYITLANIYTLISPSNRDFCLETGPGHI